MNREIPPAHDKLLFTPGPLTTSLSVKSAMLHDAGSWHFEFNALVRSIQDRILRLAGLEPGGDFDCVPMQGTGTFGVESVIGSVIPPNGKLLVLSNGAYGDRMVLMASTLKIAHTVLRVPEETAFSPAEVERALKADPAITHVAVVHSETTTGILNDIEIVGRIVSAQQRAYIVDAMSSFGAVPIDFASAHIDYLVSSANKCIEGVPGFSFVIARRGKLLETQGWARSLSLDLLGQLRGFEKNGQFRYTPPTHAILAFDQALKELDAEGGIAGRAARYKRNHEVLLTGMRKLRFRSYLAPELQSYIITSFYYPAHPNFTFEQFYRKLSDKGFIIYPGKLSQIDLFRIGNIGRLFEADIKALLLGIEEALAEMGVEMKPA
jgi:2-aminoethylphosphonate-pyruvate transaminase